MVASVVRQWGLVEEQLLVILNLELQAKKSSQHPKHMTAKVIPSVTNEEIACPFRVENVEACGVEHLPVGTVEDSQELAHLLHESTERELSSCEQTGSQGVA